MRKSRMNLLALSVACLLGVAGCENSDKRMALPDEPDYTLAETWYDNPLAQEKKAVDVFYITPTCIWDWTGQDGTTYQRHWRPTCSPRTAISTVPTTGKSRWNRG